MTAAVFRYCIKCKADRQVDGETFRCHTCGTVTKYTGVAPTPSPAPAVPEPSSVGVVALPSTRGSRQWIEQTQALADAFSRAAHEAELKASAATAEAERLRRAASAFLGLLKQVSVDAPAEPQRPNGRWSRNYDACIKCGRTDKPHAAKGLCRTCDSRARARLKTA